MCCLEYKVSEAPNIQRSRDLYQQSAFWLVEALCQTIFRPGAAMCILDGKVLKDMEIQVSGLFREPTVPSLRVGPAKSLKPVTTLIR